MRPELDPHGVDDQRIAFVMAHRIPMQGRNHCRGMRLVQPHHAEVAVVLVDERDLVRLLQQLDIEVPENVGQGVLQTHVVRVRKDPAGQRDFAELLDRLRCLGLQYRIGVIADHQGEVARAGGQPRLVPHRAWPRERGAKSEPGMQPKAGKIRNRRGTLRPAAGRPDRGRRCLRKRRCRNRPRQRHRQKKLRP